MKRVKIPKKVFDDFVYGAVAVYRAPNLKEATLGWKVLSYLESQAVPADDGTERYVLPDGHEEVFDLEDEHAKFIAARLEEHLPSLSLASSRSYAAVLMALRYDENGVDPAKALPKSKE